MVILYLNVNFSMKKDTIFSYPFVFYYSSSLLFCVSIE